MQIQVASYRGTWMITVTLLWDDDRRTQVMAHDLNYHLDGEQQQGVLNTKYAVAERGFNFILIFEISKNETWSVSFEFNS